MAKPNETSAATPEAKARKPRTPKTKTFDDHFAALSAAYRAMTEDDRERALGALRALYPHRKTEFNVGPTYGA